MKRLSVGVLCSLLAFGCASLNLGTVVQPPIVSGVEGQDPQLQLRLPSLSRPIGGAAVRLWSKIENPNGFSLTISRLAGDLFIGDGEGFKVDFPLGVALVAAGDAIVPLDVSIDFDDVPGLAEAALAALSSGSLLYRLDAIIAVDAGMLGMPEFGPSTLLQGDLRVIR